MKKLIFIFLFIPIFGFVSAQCPKKGDSPQPKHQLADSLKNRTSIGSTVIQCDVTQFLPAIDRNGKQIPVVDSVKFSPNTYVAMTGYIVGAKWEEI